MGLANQGTIFCLIFTFQSYGKISMVSVLAQDSLVHCDSYNALHTSAITPVLGRKSFPHLIQNTSSPLRNCYEETAGREKSRVFLCIYIFTSFRKKQTYCICHNSGWIGLGLLFPCFPQFINGSAVVLSSISIWPERTRQIFALFIFFKILFYFFGSCMRKQLKGCESS